MSSWVKVTRGQPQKPTGGKRSKPSGIPRLLDINPYKPSQNSSFSDNYPRDVEEQKSIEELFGQKYQYPAGSEEYWERYQYSQNDTKYNADDRREKLYLQFYQQIQKEYHKERPSDCVIVAISKDQMSNTPISLSMLQYREYATGIGHRLQDHGLVVEMIYLTSESGLTRALQEVRNDGSPFCILVEQSNVALSSCTAIILHDSIKSEACSDRENMDALHATHELHRNMPMEDALTLVVKAFGKVFGEREKQERNEISQKAADVADDYLEREPYESYSVPLDVRHLLFLLGDGKYLYTEELNAISAYVKTRITEIEGYEEADTTEEANAKYESRTGSSSLLEKPPPLLPTSGRNNLYGKTKPSLLGDRPTGLLPTPDDGVNALFEASLVSNSGTSSDILTKPPPLLPTPGRTPLLGLTSQSLLRDRGPGGLLPTPGTSGPQGKPPPLLQMTSKRPGLLGFSPHQQAKRPLLGEKPGLLPTPLAVPPAPSPLLWPSKPKPLLG